MTFRIHWYSSFVTLKMLSYESLWVSIGKWVGYQTSCAIEGWAGGGCLIAWSVKSTELKPNRLWLCDTWNLWSSQHLYVTLKSRESRWICLPKNHRDDWSWWASREPKTGTVCCQEWRLQQAITLIHLLCSFSSVYYILINCFLLLIKLCGFTF